MDLVQVDVVGAEPAEALLDLVTDPAAGVALPVHAFAHLAVHLRREHHLVAPAFERLADDLLRLALRVHVGGVDEVHAVVERVVNDAHTVGVIAVAPEPEHHGAEALYGYLDAGLAERALLHHCSRRCCAKNASMRCHASVAAVSW